MGQSFNTIDWPVANSNIPSCESVPFEMPILDQNLFYPYCDDPENCTISLSYSNSIIVGPNGGCIGIIREIILIDELTQETFEGSVIYNVDQNLLLAKENFYIHDGDPPYEEHKISAIDLIISPDPSHKYSFSSIDSSISTYCLSSSLVFDETQIYEHTTNSWYNKTELIRTGCDFPEINAITWPSASANVSSCNDIPKEFPIVNGIEHPYENCVYLDYQDVEVFDSFGNCILLNREITVLHWYSGEIMVNNIDYIVDSNLSLAKDKHYLHGLPPYEKEEISAIDLVLNPIPGHVYSFSSTDTSNTIFSLSENVLNAIVQVYEYTTNSWYNSTEIIRSACEFGDLGIVEWPPETVNVSSCIDIPEDFPTVNGLEYPYGNCTYLTYQDFESIDTSGSCTSIIREITLLHWQMGEVLIDSLEYIVDQNTHLAKDLFLIESDFPAKNAVIPASSLIENPIQGYIYSFSSIDASQNFVSLSPDENEKEVLVFEHTTKSWYNPTLIKRTPCLAGYSFSVHSSIDHEINAYFEGLISASIFDGGSYYNCGDYSIKISKSENGDFDDNIFFEPSTESGTYEVFLKFESSNGYYCIKKSFVNLTVEITEIFTKYIELKEVVAGEETEVAIWSSSIDNLLGFQYGLRINNAEFIGLSEVNPKFLFGLDANHAFIDDQFRVLWSQVLQPTNFEEDEIWYNIKIIPNESGLTSDIFSWEDLDFITQFLLEGNNALFEIGVHFNFQMAVKPTATNVYDVLQEEINLYPNPSSNNVYLDGASVSDVRSIHDVQGKEFPITILDGAIATSHLPKGIYFVSLIKNEKLITKKLVIAR